MVEPILRYVKFKKLYWTCMKCKHKWVTDGDKKTFLCPNCGKHNGQGAFMEFNDALSLTEDEYKNTTSQQMEAMKQARMDKWIQIITNPPPYQEPTLEELKNFRASLLEQIDNEIMPKLIEKASKKDLEVMKAELQDRIMQLESEISLKKVME